MIDAVIIAGDVPLDVLGKHERGKMRLTIDGHPASLSFLNEYFHTDKSHQSEPRPLDERPLCRPNNNTSFVSLNGHYLSQFLRSRGITTKLIQSLSPSREELLHLLESGARTVVISTTFLPFAAQIDSIAAFVKKHSPNTTVIAGGIQIWKSYKHKLLLDQGTITEDIRPAVSAHNYLMDPNRPSPVDVLVISDSGETTLSDLILHIKNDTSWKNLPNIAWFNNETWQINSVIPEPYKEVRVDWNQNLLDPSNIYIPIQTGMGCGFQCAFCDFCGIRPISIRPIKPIIEEIRTIPAVNGIRRVYFADDNLFPDKQRARDICNAIIDAGLALKWRGLARISVVDEEIADLMARSGCFEVLLGIESGDPEILANMKKKIAPEKILAGINLLSSRGISTKSTFIVGYPGETERSINNTIDLLNAYPTDGPAAHRHMFFTFAVLPLAKVASAQSREKYDLRGYGYEWEHSTMNAQEAAEAMANIHNNLKPELSPSYVHEVPELPGLTIDDIKQVYILRNKIVQTQRASRSNTLWKQLKKIFNQNI
ncbi:MAG: radical SAM protein [Kiritimatiellae bacterium]|nr:radical SAM protein [Kiritimatiellia bacterium]